MHPSLYIKEPAGSRLFNGIFHSMNAIRDGINLQLGFLETRIMNVDNTGSRLSLHKKRKQLLIRLAAEEMQYMVYTTHYSTRSALFWKGFKVPLPAVYFPAPV